MIKSLSFTTLLGVGLMMAGGLLVPAPSFADTTVTLSGQMRARCHSEGLTDEVCACWFVHIAQAEGKSELTESDVDHVAHQYQKELQACKEANPSH